jgi:hypothetical protein
MPIYRKYGNPNEFTSSIPSSPSYFTKTRPLLKEMQDTIQPRLKLERMNWRKIVRFKEGEL